MDTRNFVLLIVAVIIGACIVLSSNYAKMEAARAELADAKEELAELEDYVEDTAEAGGTVAKVDQLAANYETVEIHKKALAETVIDLEAKRDASLRAFRDAVESVRSKSVGAPWTDVPFRNGQMLRGVRIQKISETEVTFAHSEGVARLKTDELPPDLKERFRVGMEPFLSTPASSTSTVSAISSATPTTKSTDSTKKNPSPGEALTSIATEAKVLVASLEEQLAASTAKMENTRSTMWQWRNRASNLQGQAVNAKGSGRPSYNLYKEAAEAEKTANGLESQLNTLRAENSLLHQKLSSARVEAVRAQSAANRRR